MDGVQVLIWLVNVFTHLKQMRNSPKIYGDEQNYILSVPASNFMMR